jgi:hypothetical protein
MNDWVLYPAGGFEERYVYLPSSRAGLSTGTLRVLKTPEGSWQVRFDGNNEDAIRETLPGHLSVDEVEAAALVIWRMK